jgi:phosphoribosylglycinamide formyltransferase-1
MKPPRVAIFASGTGSNAEALMKKMKEHELQQLGKIEFVLSDRKGALVLEKAAQHDVKSYLVEKTVDRASHEKEILKLIELHRIDWVFLAGYMRIISADFLKSMALRHQGNFQVVNIHPSLLPAYPGSKSLERAFEDKVSESGVTLHYVDEGMDTGPHIAQEKVQIHAEDSFSDFKSRMHALEHKMYTKFLEQIVRGEIPTNYFEEVISC